MTSRRITPFIPIWCYSLVYKNIFGIRLDLYSKVSPTCFVFSRFPENRMRNSVRNESFLAYVYVCVSIWCLLLKSYKVSRVYQASGSSEQVTLDTAGRRGFGVKDSYKPRSIHSTPPATITTSIHRVKCVKSTQYNNPSFFFTFLFFSSAAFSFHTGNVIFILFWCFSGGVS